MRRRADTCGSRPGLRSSVSVDERPFDAYVPRGVLRHLATEPFSPVRSVPGSMLFADLSGFTKLSERLQRRGPEGAELLVNTINGVFAALLRVAYDNGGSLIKFGGDALLLFFEGDRHAERAARSAYRMRERLRTVGRIEVSGVRGVLRMTVGVHSDIYHFFLVGESHLDHLVLGPGAGGIVRTEELADNGQIVVSAATAAELPTRCVGQAVGDGFLLRADPLPDDLAWMEPVARPENAAVARCLSTAVRAHLAGGRSEAEHRRASVAFLHFAGTDALIEAEGLAATAAVVGELVADAQRAADEWEICYLDSDIGADGAKILFSAGAPRVIGDDEERMLLAMRQILERPRRLPVRIGVNRGPVFTGEIGPPYRRAYIVMGDTTNLAARVMGKSSVGELWATEGILARARIPFATTAQPPFAAKGKAKPVHTWAVGAPISAAALAADADAFPFVGRSHELAVVSEALVAAGAGLGRALDLVGDAGVGKSRLLSQAISSAPDGLQVLGANCEAHLSGVPYSLWHGVLRRLLGLAWDDKPAVVVDALQRRCAHDPDLAPWLPLLGDACGVEMPPTAATAALLPQFREARLIEVLGAFLAPELEAPTVLRIDSAHLIDEASAGLLAGLLPRLASSRWAVVALRRGGPSRFDEVAEAGAQRVDVGPLDLADTRALAEAATDADPLPPHVVEVAVTRSGGNPQFLLDLLAARGTDLPDSAQAAAMAQIDALPPGDRTLVRRASLLGSTFPPQLAHAVLGADEDGETWRRVEALIAVTPDGHLRFRRAAVQEAAYAALPYAERRALHARIADALESGAAGVADPAVVGHHHRCAGRHDRAWPLNRTAARRAAARAAPADAAALYRDALESAREIDVSPAELAEVWEGLGDALRLAAEGPAADRAYREARRAVGPDPLWQAELLHRQARLSQRAGHPAAGVRWARRGLKELGDADDARARGWRARLLAAEASNRMDQGKRRLAVELCERSLALAATGSGEVAERATAHASFLLDWALVTLGRAAEATHSARALQIYERLGELEDASHVLNNMGMFAYWTGRWDEAVRLYGESGAVAERIGDQEVVAATRANVGEVLSDQGHWARARTELGVALRIWRAAGNIGGVGFARMLLGRTAAREGRFDEGIELLESAVADLSAHGMDDAVVAAGYLAEALAMAGRVEPARAAVARLDTRGGDAEPLRLRVRALVAESPRDVVAGLFASLTAARVAGSDHDAAIALHLLLHLAPTHPDAPRWRMDHDALCAALGIEAMSVPAAVASITT